MRIILKDGTGIVDLKFLRSDFDRHGNVRLYCRRKGRSIRLREKIGTPGFIEEYRAALVAIDGAVTLPSIKPAAPESLRWLVQHYIRSADFQRLNTTTQTIRRRDLDGLVERHGDKRFGFLENRHVRALRDERSNSAQGPTPHAANNFLKTVRSLFKWAVEVNLLERNPARDVPKIKAPSDGHHTWTEDEIRQFLARHPPSSKAGLAMALMFFLGVRRSDVVKLGPQHETPDGYLRLVESKGAGRQKKITTLFIQPELRAVLDSHSGAHLTYITTAYRAPFSVAGFGNWFKEQCRLAGLGHCSAHGLRKAAATVAANNGATEIQLMAQFGWTTPGMAAHYTKRVNRKLLATQASKLISIEDQKGNESVPLLGGVAPGGTNRAKYDAISMASKQGGVPMGGRLLSLRARSLAAASFSHSILGFYLLIRGIGF